MKHQSINIFLILFISFVFEANANPYVRINESFSNTPLKEALNTLKVNYNLKIAYSDRAIGNITLNTEIKNLTIYETFQKILEPTSLTFELLEKDIIIIKKKPKGKAIEKSTFSLIGVVQDISSGERLPYAYVWLEPENRNILTNVDGYFSISVTSLPITLRISYLGYQDATLIIDGHSANKRLYVNMVSNLMELDEVVILEEVTDDFEISASEGKIDINPKISYSMPSAGELDLMRTIQLLPGINATNESSAGLSIQGGNTNQNLFLFDGFTIYHMDHFLGYFSAINPSALKSVQLYKSGYDARFGGRVSGIVDMSGKEGNLNKTSGSLGINLLSINTSLEIPLKRNRSSLFFSGRRSYTDFISTSLFEKIFANFAGDLSGDSQSTTSGNIPTGGHMGNAAQITTQENNVIPEFYYTDLNLKFSSKIGLKDHISVSFYDSNDILNFKESNVTNINDTLTITKNTLGLVNWGNTGTSLKWSRLWNQLHYTNALISYSSYESRYDEANTSIGTSQNQEYTISTTFEQSNSIQDITLKVDHEWFLPKEQLIRFGMQTKVLGTIYRSKSDDLTFVEHIELNKSIVSLYGLSVLQPISGMTLNLGLRGNYYSNTDKWYPEPRISLSQQATPRIRLKGAYGIYHQFINQSNTKNALQGSRDFWLLADATSIPVQRATHLSTGLDYRFGGFVFNVDYFRKDFNGLLEYAFSNGGLVTEFDNYDEMFFEGSGNAEGIEFLLKKTGKSFNAWLGYTYSEVKYSFDEINEGINFYADHDQRHEINTYGSYNFGKLELFGSWVYGSGKPYTKTNRIKPHESTMNDFDEHVTVLEIDEKNGLRLPQYHRLDIGGKYTFLFNDFNAVLALSIFNLYNQQNVVDYRFNQILMGHSTGHGMQNNSIVESNSVKSMGITPNISLTINF